MNGYSPAERARRTAVIHRAVCKAGGDFRQSCQQKSSEEGEARDSRPDVEARQDFWSIFVGDYICRNHVAPTTKLFVPEDDFPILLNHVDIQRQTKTSIDVLQEATIDDNWNTDGDKSLSELWIGVTRLALLNKNQPEGYMWVPKQTDEKKKKGHYKTRNMWSEEWSNISEGSQGKAVK